MSIGKAQIVSKKNQHHDEIQNAKDKARGRRVRGRAYDQEFVDVHVSDDTKRRLRESGLDLAVLDKFLWNLVMEYDYSVSIKKDARSGGAAVWISGRADHEYNPKKTVGSRGPGPLEALQVAMFKIGEVLGFEEWLSQEDDEDLWG